MTDTLDHGILGAGDDYRALRRIGQKVRRHLDADAGRASYLFDFRAAFADQATALRRRDDQLQDDGRRL